MTIDGFFGISKRGSSVGREIMAGFSTFAAMSYILAVNPAILSAAGMDKPELVTVTALAAAFGCFLMAFMTNLPIALAPAMGTNTYFAIIICVGMGLTWQEALALTFYNGIFFFIISVTGLREKLIKGVPRPLQIGLQCGIGIFIAFFGLQNARLIVADPHTLVTMGGTGTPEALLVFCGLGLMFILMSLRIKSAIILSIALMTVAAFCLDGSDAKKIAEIPSSLISMPHGISETLFKLDFLYPFREANKALPIIIVLLMLDLFDTLATLIAMGRQSGLMDTNGRMEKMGAALTADASATIVGAVLGTSTTGAYVESSAGIESGGRTGLTSITVGILFLLALFFNPLINAIPSIATAPALIVVGILMFKSLSGLKFDDMAELLPAVFCILMITFSFKISEGFAFGIISYVTIMAATGRHRQINVYTWIMFALMCVFMVMI